MSLAQTFGIRPSASRPVAGRLGRACGFRPRVGRTAPSWRGVQGWAGKASGFRPARAWAPRPWAR